MWIEKYFSKYPQTDDEALEFLAESSPDIIERYHLLRESGMSIEKALIEVTDFDYNRTKSEYDTNETKSTNP